MIVQPTKPGLGCRLHDAGMQTIALRRGQHCCADAVQVATWIKRQFALKPAINRLRTERAAQRPLLTNQVADMY